MALLILKHLQRDSKFSSKHNTHQNMNFRIIQTDTELEYFTRTFSPTHPFFAYVFTKENTNKFAAVKQCFQGHKNKKKICSFNVSSNLVLCMLKLKMSKAAGIDSSGTRMLLELSEKSNLKN